MVRFMKHQTSSTQLDRKQELKSVSSRESHSAYAFEFVNSNSKFDKAMRCQSKLMSVGRYTYGCHVGDGDTPVPCVSPEPEYISFSSDSTSITRGWSGRREDEGGRRVHYLWRRLETPQEGYINCHFRDDINPVLGLYVLYPSEYPSLVMIILVYMIPILSH